MVKEINIAKALIRYNGKYLMLRKADDAYFQENIGKWECPGGEIEENETPEQTILREVKEETGFICKIIKELPSLGMVDENYNSYCRVYLLEAPEENITLNTKEHTNYQWTKPEQVKDLELALYVSLLLEFFNNPDTYFN